MTIGNAKIYTQGYGYFLLKNHDMDVSLTNNKDKIEHHFSELC